MLTIFANLRINSETRLQHLKDSFRSFSVISDNWLVNIRGALRKETLDFLKKNLGPKGVYFELLDDSRGWTKNALEMVSQAKYSHLLVWNEDHFNLASPKVYQELAENLKESDTDYMQYSWWNFGKLRLFFESFPLNHFERLDTIELTKDIWLELKKKGHSDHLISLNGIYKKEFFIKLLKKDQEKIPFVGSSLHHFAERFLKIFGITSGREKYFHWVNQKLFKNRLSRFSKETPFNLERDPSYSDILPFKLALPQQELFACIDDDAGMQPGYQLIKRGLYPLEPFLKIRHRRTSPQDNQSKQFQFDRGFRQNLPRFYEDVLRTEALLIQTLEVTEGSLSISAQNQKIELKSREAVDLYTNLSYQIEAHEKTTAVLNLPSLKNKKIIHPET